MPDKFFVDSNVLVHRRDTSAGDKQARADAWLRLLWQDGSGRISVQVLEEFYTTVTRKLTPGLTPQEAIEEARDFFVWQPLALTADLLEAAWQCEQRYRLSFWDSLIAAAAQASGCRYLLTEDLQDGQRLGDLTVIDPFQHEPGPLTGDQPSASGPS